MTGHLDDQQQRLATATTTVRIRSSRRIRKRQLLPSRPNTNAQPTPQSSLSSSLMVLCVMVSWMCCTIFCSSETPVRRPDTLLFFAQRDHQHLQHQHYRQQQHRKQQEQLPTTEAPASDERVLERRYNMSGPVFKYGNYSFTMEFTVSDYIEDSAVNYRLYDGHNCKDGRPGDTNGTVWNNDTQSSEGISGDVDITDDVNSPLNARLRTDLTPTGDGSGIRTMKVTVDLDGTKLSNSTIYRTGNTSGYVEFCVRLGVFNMPLTFDESEEVNFIEVPVRLNVGLTEQFRTRLDVDTDLLVELAFDDKAVEAYLCDNDENIVSFGSAAQGEAIRVCIRPTEEARNQGAYLRQIEEFTFQRDNYTQQAIVGGTAADELTIVSCFSGATVCAFETLLNSDFFQDGLGVVFGTGTAYLQLGEESIDQGVRARVLSKSGRRSQELQQVIGNDILAERSTIFALQVVVVPEGKDVPKYESLWDGESASNRVFNPRRWALSSVLIGTLALTLGCLR